MQQQIDQKPEMQEGDLVSQVNHLIAGEDIREDETADEAEAEAVTEQPEQADPEGESADPGTLTLKALAERLKIDPSDLYKIQVGMPDGADPMTLGQLKDLGQKNVDFDRRQHELTETERKFRNDTMQTRQEIAQVLAQVPKQYLSPEVVSKARQQWQTYNQAEYTLTRERIPDYEQVRPKLVELVQEYVIDEAEFDAVPDHRFRAILDDLRKYRDRYAEADAAAKEVTTTPKPLRSRVKSKEPEQLKHARHIRQANTEDKKVAAITQLLSG